MDFLFFFGLFHCTKSQFRYSDVLPSKDLIYSKVMTNQMKIAVLSKVKIWTLCYKRVLLLNRIKLHSHTIMKQVLLISTHNDDVLPTANENNCKLNEFVVKHQLLPPCKCKRNCFLKLMKTEDLQFIITIRNFLKIAEEHVYITM